MAQIRQNNEFYETHGLVTSDGELVTAENPLPVTLGSENITITGDVNVSSDVHVNNGSTDPVYVALSPDGQLNSEANPIFAEISNDAGNPIPVAWEYQDGATLIPWEVQVARGKITGVAGLSISGYQAAVPTSWVPIWEYATAYTYLSSAENLRVWSSSASDTNISVLINGLDANYAPITETVTLTNGTTGVLTTQQFLRVNSMSLTRTPMNVGNISAGNSGKTIQLCTIEPDSGRSQMSIYTVPAGYTFYLTQVNVYTNQTGSQTALYRSYTKSAAGVVNKILTFPFVDQYNSKKVVARPYPEKTDIQWQCQSSNGDSRVGIQIEGYLIANSVG